MTKYSLVVQLESKRALFKVIAKTPDEAIKKYYLGEAKFVEWLDEELDEEIKSDEVIDIEDDKGNGSSVRKRIIQTPDVFD